MHIFKPFKVKVSLSCAPRKTASTALVCSLALQSLALEGVEPGLGIGAGPLGIKLGPGVDRTLRTAGYGTVLNHTGRYTTVLKHTQPSRG